MSGNKSEKENQNDNKELIENIEFNINIDTKNSLEKKDAFSQTKNKENGLLNELQNETYNAESKNENNEYFEQKLKSGNQTLDNDENPNNKIIRRNKDYNLKILNKKNLLIQSKEIENKGKKKPKNNDKKNLNKMLLEKEMNEIKKKLEQKQKQKEKRDKESEKAANDYMKLRNKILKENYHNIFQKQVPKEKNSISLESDGNYEKINNPSNNDICSQLLRAAMDNEKKLLLVPYAKQKEKIKKTFNTIGKLNGISYSEFRVIKGTEMDSNNIYNIIRDDDRKILSKRKDYSESNSMKRSNYSILRKFTGNNSEFKL